MLLVQGGDVGFDSRDGGGFGRPSSLDEDGILAAVGSGMWRIREGKTMV